MLLIVNPAASAVSRAGGQRVARALDRRYTVELAETRGPGHAAELARAAVRDGYAFVAVLGGDGTVNEAANGLAGTDVPLACLPAGCTNVFARTLGLPEDLSEAVDRLLSRAPVGRQRRVDLGVMNERYFTFASGVGLSAGLNRHANGNPRRKASLGSAYLAYAALKTMGTEYFGRPPRVRLSVEGRSVDGVTVVAQNSDPLTYLGSRPIRVCEGAGLATGTVSLALLRRAGPREVGVVPRVVSGRAAGVVGHPQVKSFPAVAAAEVTPIGGGLLPVEVDGEYVGELSSVRYGIAPRALAIA